MSQSQKHHFLPVFYLKGFANENEQFKIFNVKTKRFKQKGIFFSPSSHFYILKDNTITTDFGEDDFNSNTFENRFGLSETYMPHINNFVSQIYWRSPFNKNIFQDYIKRYKLKELDLKIIDENGKHDEELSEKFKNEPEFYKAYKLYNSLLDSIRGFNCRTQYHIFARPRELPSICSDSPIIFSKNNDIKVYEDDYIFPISKSRIFIKRNLIQKFNHQLHHLIDLILLKQSINYLATSDESYVDFLMGLDKENNYSLDEYKEILFNNLV
ncbi:DUF4238 domain-containing protein [Chryseobacterium sediminis]|uniref:DUF4238 domain-containing protein n=1 Tax=Chryseobacterium sediminis TaxID=1679494 RepID=UPI00286798F6|nr:DUF4238 domain-containing protein [Chryseobacterium sediminis]MDR6466244.1 hypothetical protein [Chryseobacterium sediminis]